MSPPPYYGARITLWGQGKFGWGFELTHDKIYANDETLANAGFRIAALWRCRRGHGYPPCGYSA